MASPPEGMNRADFVRAVDGIIRQRKTRKVLDGALSGVVASGGANQDAVVDFRSLVQECLETAGWAPFHYARNEDIPEPWRFYVLEAEQLAQISQRAPELMMGKLPKIFAGAGAMVQATWIPEQEIERAGRNWEHAAAAAAAVQNLLLAAEARGMGTYWSSAKPLASERMFQLCGIPPHEVYLGSVFLGKPLPEDREASDGFSGKMRPRRSPCSQWAKWVSLSFDD